MNLFKRFLVLANLFLLAFFGLPFNPAQANQPAVQIPIYLEIHEDNIDSFPFHGHTEGQETLNPPFWIENGKAMFDPELADIIARNEAKENYNLLIAPEKFDQKSIKLLVKHEIRFEGKGRVSESSRYYMFDRWPAQILFEPMNIDRSEISIALDENEGKLLNIRLTEDMLLIDLDQLTGKLRCKYGSIVSDLPQNRPWAISEKSQKISVSRQVTSRNQMKNSGGANLPEASKREFGEVEFRTKLTLKNLGPISLA